MALPADGEEGLDGLACSSRTRERNCVRLQGGDSTKDKPEASAGRFEGEDQVVERCASGEWPFDPTWLSFEEGSTWTPRGGVGCGEADIEVESTAE